MQPPRPEPKKNKIETLPFEETAAVITARGSIYHYLPDGTTRRFKKSENKKYDPQTALVYIPDFKFVQTNAPKNFLDTCNNCEIGYQQLLLEYVQGKDKSTKIIDGEGNQLLTNQQVKDSPQVYLALISKNNSDEEKADFIVPISVNPKIGSYTYDTRKYTDPISGEEIRERHLGNKVVEILAK